MDYFAGNGQKIPGSYNVNNITAQVGIDLGSYTKLETPFITGIRKDVPALVRSFRELGRG